MVHSIYIHFNSGLDKAFYLIPIFPNMAAIFMELELAIPSTRGSPLPFPQIKFVLFVIHSHQVLL